MVSFNRVVLDQVFLYQQNNDVCGICQEKICQLSETGINAKIINAIAARFSVIVAHSGGKSHPYHAACVRPWADQYKTCPSCRTGVNQTPLVFQEKALLEIKAIVKDVLFAVLLSKGIPYASGMVERTIEVAVSKDGVMPTVISTATGLIVGTTIATIMMAGAIAEGTVVQRVVVKNSAINHSNDEGSEDSQIKCLDPREALIQWMIMKVKSIAARVGLITLGISVMAAAGGIGLEESVAYGLTGGITEVATSFGIGLLAFYIELKMLNTESTESEVVRRTGFCGAITSALLIAGCVGISAVIECSGRLVPGMSITSVSEKAKNGFSRPVTIGLITTGMLSSISSNTISVVALKPVLLGASSWLVSSPLVEVSIAVVAGIFERNLPSTL